MSNSRLSPTLLPRITIQFCTQCKWMLRAAYFAQELLSTFGTALGEVALQPATGGTFIVEMYYAGLASDEETGMSGEVRVEKHLLWDRKEEGGFPETKELKRRVRDIIDPGRDLGHVDGKKKTSAAPTSSPSTSASFQNEPRRRTHDEPPSEQTSREVSELDAGDSELVEQTSSMSLRPTLETMESGHLPQNDRTGENISITKRGNTLLDGSRVGSESDRKFTPMDLDTEERKGSRNGEFCEDCA